MAARDDLDESGTLERWLRSWPHRVALVALLVLAVSVLESLRWYDAFAPESRMRVGVVLLRWTVLRNALWGLVALTLVPLSLRFVPGGSWAAPAFVLLQLGLSAGSGYLVPQAQDRLVQSLGLDSPWDLLRQEMRERWLQQLEEREGRRASESTDPGATPRGGDAGPGDRPEGGRGEGAPPPPDGSRRDWGGPPRGDVGRGGRRPGFGSSSLAQTLGSGMLTYWAVLAAVATAAAHLRTQSSRREASRAEHRRLELERELSDTRLSSLESQLRPHFLFNALHSVGGLVRLGRQAEAQRALSTLGQLLRDTLDRSGGDSRPLQEEWTLARRYLDVEAVRFGERLVVREELPPELREARVPALLLLPLVENAVRHGVGARSEPVTLTLRARRTPDGGLALEVEDDGPPFPADVLDGSRRSTSGGIGLSNTRARLHTLYGERAALELENPARGGALVRVLLPPPGQSVPPYPGEPRP